jgi:hypothetical protein
VNPRRKINGAPEQKERESPERKGIPSKNAADLAAANRQ